MYRINRRRFERFSLPVGYSPVTVRLVADDTYAFDGHAYDVCEGGVRFELDRLIEPGTPVSLRITFPGAGDEESRSVLVVANVVWALDDPDEPGPVRMAAAFTRFASAADKARLLDQLGAGRYARAA
jgi:hypothetical protein